jgi:parallel beta-helix repeat protein
MSKPKQSKNRICELRNVGIILVGVVALSLLVGVVSATTWTVDDSGSADFTRIQDAINASNPGDTIEVRSGTYYENVDIDKQLILTGIDTGTGKPVVDAGEIGSVITISAGGCVVNGFNVTGSGSNWGEAGIKIRSGDNEIVNNTCSDNINGIFFEEPYGGHSSANNNTVSNNTVCHNNENGIYVYRSHYNIITSNTVNSNINDGIKLGHATHNMISNNVANSNKDAGIDLSRSFYNIFINNTANSNYECGIGLYKSLNNTFVGNSVSANEDGIGLSGSNNNTFANNTANSNTDGGFYLDELSNNNTIANNNISSNNDDGINMDDSFYNIITNNTILNNYNGLYLDHSSNNTVANNSVSLNRGNGIGLEDSAENNTIIGNTISSNKETGIYIELCNNNWIYHNNFINNGDQAYDDRSNFWDNGYPSGGNYWGDHTCYGNPSSGSQPYYIDTYGVDHYPFQDPNGWLKPKPTPTPTPTPVPVFDTSSPSNPYPSIFGTHNGTIKPNQTITVSKLYTYPCSGTGGHSEYMKIWDSSDWNVTARWDGYKGDWHNISFGNSFTLEEGETYNYTIRTGSYPQIYHTVNLSTSAGFITCSEFVDVNGKRYNGWIPAVRLE